MKKNLIKNLIFVGVIIIYIIFCFIQTPITQAVTMVDETAIGSMWSLLPAIIAIGLALITKEVYSSLFIGIVSGAVISAVSFGTGFEGVMNCIVGMV